MCHVAQRSPHGGEHVVWEAGWKPAVGAVGDSFESGWCEGGEQQRRAWSLDRLGLDRRRSDAHVVAVVLDDRVRPDRLEHVEGVVESGAELALGYPDSFVLIAGPAEPEPDVEAAAADVVER